jgi:hypothetical protein
MIPKWYETSKLNKKTDKVVKNLWDVEKNSKIGSHGNWKLR